MYIDLIKCYIHDVNKLYNVRRSITNYKYRTKNALIIYNGPSIKQFILLRFYDLFRAF